MIVPEIIIDQGSIDRATARLTGIKNGVGIATAGAINDLLKQSRTQLAKAAAGEVVIKYGRVLKQIKISRASPQSLAGKISVNDKARPGLHNFGARPGKRGVTYRISKSGGRKRIASGFEAKGRPRNFATGETSQAEEGRTKRIFRRVGKARKPLADLKGPSLNRVIVANDIDDKTSEIMRQKLPDRIDARVNLLIQKGAASG